MSQDEGLYGSIDVGTTDFSSMLSDLAVIETLARRYRGNFRMPRLIFPTLSITPGGRSSFSDADGLATASLMHTGDRGWVFNGATWDRLRGGNLILKTGSFAAAGDNTLWTPAAGKKFRLFGYFIFEDGQVAAAANDLIKLTDGAGGTAIAQFNPWIPAALAAGNADFMEANMPANGYLSAAANNLLTVNIATALTAGTVTANAWGLEE